MVRVRVKDALRTSVTNNYVSFRRIGIRRNGAETICASRVFLAAAVWGGQWGGHICVWGAKNFG